MRIGIVGSEAAKFTVRTEEIARHMIRKLLRRADEAVSGACHLGGIDLWAAEEARSMTLGVIEFPPATRAWTGGYKERNIQIADYSDEVWCITVKELPGTYTGMRFPLCYHCGTTDHVKSGGCWTVKYAKKIGKPGGIICI